MITIRIIMYSEWNNAIFNKRFVTEREKKDPQTKIWFYRYGRFEMYETVFHPIISRYLNVGLKNSAVSRFISALLSV